jgi:hypothetical protein
MISKLGRHLALGLALFGASGCVIGPKPDDPLQVDSGVPGAVGDTGYLDDAATGFVTDAAGEGGGGGVPDASSADTTPAVDAAADGDAGPDLDAADAADAADAGDAADASDAASTTDATDATDASAGG